MTLAPVTVRNYSYIPNLLSSVRIVIAPAILAASYANSRVGFSVLLGAALLTDLLDGWIARRWKTETPLGRRLDRWGDGLTATLGAIAVGFLWPDIVEREIGWMLAALAGYAMLGTHRLLLPSRAASQPTWVSRVLGAIVPLSLIPLINGWHALPFQVAAAVHAAVGLHKLVMSDPVRPVPPAAEATALLPEIQN